MPATVIDALVVTLGLDKSKFEQGETEANKGIKKTKESALKAGKDMEAAGKQAAVFFSKLRNEAIMFVGALAGAAGIKSFTTNMVGAARGVGFTSQALDVGIRRLQAWQTAARMVGASASDMNAQLTESQNAVAMMRRGLLAPGVQEFFARGGQGNVQTMTAEQYLQARISVLQQIRARGGSVSDQRLAAQQMGLSDSLFNLFRKGNTAIGQMLVQAGKVDRFTKEDAENANKLSIQWIFLSQNFQKAGVRIGAVLLPYIERLVEWLQKVADWVNGHQDVIRGWIEKAVKWFGELISKLDDGVKAVGGWKNVLIALAALKVVSMVAPLLSLAAALSNVGGALGLIGRLGPAALAVLGGLWIARDLGLPDTDVQKGHQDLASGEWLKASADLPAKQFTQAAMIALRGQATSDRAKRAFEMLTDAGYTPEQAAGIVGNLIQESGLDPTNRNKKSGAYGIAQWLSADRRAAFKKMFGHDITQSTFDEQMKYLIAEMAPGGLRAPQGAIVRQAKTVDQAAMLFMRHVEAPGKDEAMPWKRQIAGAMVLANERKLQGQARTPPAGALPLGAWNMVGANRGVVTRENTTNTTSIAVNGPVTVTTQATDAKGVADGLREYISRRVMPMAENTGLQ